MNKMSLPEDVRIVFAPKNSGKDKKKNAALGCDIWLRTGIPNTVIEWKLSSIFHTIVSFY